MGGKGSSKTNRHLFIHMQTHIGVLLFTQEIIIYTGNYFLRIIIYVRWEEKAQVRQKQDKKTLIYIYFYVLLFFQVRQKDTYLYTCRHSLAYYYLHRTLLFTQEIIIYTGNYYLHRTLLFTQEIIICIRETGTCLDTYRHTYTERHLDF